MAESAMSFVLGKLNSLLVDEVKLLREMPREIEEIRDEFQIMQSFLRDADARVDTEECVKTWVQQVREMAYDTEDVLDTYVLRLARQQHHHRPHHSFLDFIQTSTRFFTLFKARHVVATQIQDIKTRLRSITERRNTYNLNAVDVNASSSSYGAHGRLHDPRLASLFIEEAELVGIEGPRNELLSKLVEGEPGLGSIAVVGMAGLGKTTLVKKVYDDERVKALFECYAWMTLSQSFQIDQLLRSMIKQFYKARREAIPEEIEKAEGIDLMVMLRDYLHQKRYVVVLDDVWHAQVWEEIKHALPDSRCGSRIIITTRIRDVADSFIQTPGQVYDLQPLPSQEAWALFCNKAFCLDLEKRCPPELEALSQKILERCAGLPLAIVAISSLLSKKAHTQIEWQTVLDRLGSKLESNDNLKSVKRILLLSYDDLPYQLKSCFMYFCIFPGSYSIKCMRLIRLWMAEGFVQGKEGKTAEEAAADYLTELINRSMIQVSELSTYGSVRGCRIHDLMREVILLKSQEQNFCMNLGEWNASTNDRIRRLSISENVDFPQSGFSHVRSLFMFGVGIVSNSSRNVFFSSFRLLKVLDLENMPMQSFPKALSSLFHLRYLSLRNTNIRMLSKSIGKLRNLQTLDLKGTHVSDLPIEILHLRNLRHLLIYHYDEKFHLSFNSTHGVKVPAGIGRLRSLQKLSYLDANQSIGVIGELGNLNQLRRLGVIKLRKEDGFHLCASVAKMNHLRSFSAKSAHESEFLDLQSLSSPPPFLQRLYLGGHLEKLPQWILSLQNLRRLHLRWSRLTEEPLKALQALPNLMELLLCQAYDGEELCFNAGGFQRLRILILQQMRRLNLVRMEEGALPQLGQLSIRHCKELKEVPLGIEHLTNLKELYLYEIMEEFVKRLRREGGEDYWRVRHIRIIRSHYRREASQHWVHENLS